MNSIFTVHNVEEADVFGSSGVAHQFFEVLQIFAETVESETLFKEPSVTDEGVFRGVVF